MQATTGQQGFFDAGELKASLTPTNFCTFDGPADNECCIEDISDVRKKTIAGRLAVIAIVPGKGASPRRKVRRP